MTIFQYYSYWKKHKFDLKDKTENHKNLTKE